MAKKISQLTQATEVKSDDVTVIVQDGETKKLPLNMMVTKQDIENKKIAGLAKLDEIEATYENDTYTPTITVENKSSVKTGEGDEVDYSANVMDGHVKSAILKGQTLVNLVGEDKKRNTIANGGDIRNLTTFSASKEYTFYFKVEQINDNGLIRLQYLNGSTFISGENKNIVIGVNTITFTTPANTTDVRIQNSNGGIDLIIDDFMILEGDYTNADISYFEGMQSVKMPVLTTTGKNLANQLLPLDSTGTSVTSTKIENSSKVLSSLIKIRPNQRIVISKNNAGSRFRCFFFDRYPVVGETTSINGLYADIATTIKATSPVNSEYLLVVWCNDKNTEYPINYQVEYGSEKTDWVPYKSNILTVNEEVELRGIGDVKDELNLITGEVTQRIGEIVIDGSDDEAWNGCTPTNDSVVSFLLDLDGKPNSANFTNNKMINKPTWDANVEGIWADTNIILTFKRSTLTTHDLTRARQWLSQNPITVQYELETPIVKTVDLMPSGTHPSTTPYCWKNGHIQLSSSGLLPNLEYSVVTSRAGQINQNATMIVKNDKRIFDLEILLAGGLVNTTYQALTLQNQVETGLSKVSLSSETEPDYLLYHMIMKLIEEKAYKLDDLTEKVSVFYLYEKLSDEQFETIYSALYPFVEDEIVEEPVVEELPEVVEDEVIM